VTVRQSWVSVNLNHRPTVPRRRSRSRHAFMGRGLTTMKAISNEPERALGLDFEESLEGFIRFLNWLSVIPYMPAITATVGVLAGVLLRLVRLKSAGRVFVVSFALNWMSVRWLEHHFLSPAREQHQTAWGRRLATRRHTPGG
jgi:hypothetical protein